MNDWIPRIPVGSWVSDAVDWISVNLRFLLDFFKGTGIWLNDLVTTVLLTPPPLVMIVIFAVLAWLVRSWRLAVGVVITFLLILSMNQWTQSMQTLSLVLIATLTAVIIAVPLGIWAARNDTVSAFLKPILDLMQSLPAMVYLVPASWPASTRSSCWRSPWPSSPASSAPTASARRSSPRSAR